MKTRQLPGSTTTRPTAPASDPWPDIEKALSWLPMPSVIIEVGAYDGEDTKRLYQAAPKPCRLFAFEPDPRNHPRWLEALLPLLVAHPGAIEGVPLAVGSGLGRKTFYLSTGSEASSSLRKPTGHLTKYPHVAFPRECDVDVTSLDEFLTARGFDSFGFLWADAQGAERDIIVGARQTLRHAHFVYLEQYAEEMYEGAWALPEMIREMDARGFGVAKLYPGDVLFYNREKYPVNPFEA